MDSSVIIKEMDSSDAASAALPEKLYFSDSWSENAIIESLQSESFYGICAYENNSLVGYVFSYIVCDICELARIAVSSEKRRSGIGSGLMDALFEHCKRKNVSTVNLEVRQSNTAAIALYEAHGFKPVGRRKDYYTSPVEDALLYSIFFDIN